MGAPEPASLLQRVEQLNAIGIALSAETDPVRLLEQILIGAKVLTNADGGSIYSVDEVAGQLRFEIVRNDTLGLALGGTSGRPIPFPPIPLRHEDGSANTGSVVAHSVLTRHTVNVTDAYAAAGFDFSGTRAFDARTGYRSASFLTVPMTNHEGVITGVLQLINAREPSGLVVAFSKADQRLAESLASQAAIAMTKHDLIEGMRRLFDAFIKLIATAIDEKSPYTGGHCRRVPALTMMLAEAAAGTTIGPLAGFTMSPADRYELSIAAWLHDCGKITTPEWVMDKATKLQTIYDRIGLLAVRYDVLRRDSRILMLESIIDGTDTEVANRLHADRLRELDGEFAFLQRINTGGEAMAAGDQERVRQIAQRPWKAPDGSAVPFLSPDEVENLTIVRGTLTASERSVINHHIVATIRMLESLPYPKHLQRVPEFAGGHHERMDGKGYPKGLRREQMSVQARVMGIADVFEALTSADRPYKKAMPMSQALSILKRMKDEGHIDPDLYDVFIGEGVHLAYAKRFLRPEQIDIDLPAGIESIGAQPSQGL